jgi:alpha-L-glutamate ligase-like protein
VISRLRRLRAEVLGLNRRNHAYLFAWNVRARLPLVDDKRATKAALGAAGVPVPMLLDVCEVQAEVPALGARLAAREDFVLKPARGAGGAGIVVIVGRRAGRFVKASGASVTRAALEIHACDVIGGAFSPVGRGDAVLVEERVIPEPVLAALAHRGVPDIRVLVFRGVPLLAMLRLPTRRSDGRANLHLGGVGVGIDLASGVTTSGVCGRTTLTHHPETGLPLAGTVVPVWEEILRLAARAADAVGLDFLGVDLVVDARHGPLVLELNARPGLAIQVANRRGLRPLLEAVAVVSPPADPPGRVALGRRLSGSALRAEAPTSAARPPGS